MDNEYRNGYIEGMQEALRLIDSEIVFAKTANLIMAMGMIQVRAIIEENLPKTATEKAPTDASQ